MLGRAGDGAGREGRPPAGPPPRSPTRAVAPTVETRWCTVGMALHRRTADRPRPSPAPRPATDRCASGRQSSRFSARSLALVPQFGGEGGVVGRVRIARPGALDGPGLDTPRSPDRRSGTARASWRRWPGRPAANRRRRRPTGPKAAAGHRTAIAVFPQLGGPGARDVGLEQITPSDAVSTTADDGGEIGRRRALRGSRSSAGGDGVRRINRLRPEPATSRPDQRRAPQRPRHPRRDRSAVHGLARHGRTPASPGYRASIRSGQTSGRSDPSAGRAPAS